MARERQPAIYILASARNGTLYVGVTSDLIKRTWIHKTDLLEGFSKQHQVHMLVWFELCDSMEVAIQREKRIKKWNRAWKIRLIEQSNPYWRDLWDDLG